MCRKGNYKRNNETQELILRVTMFLDFVHRPEFQIARKHNVSETAYVSVLIIGFIYSPLFFVHLYWELGLLDRCAA
jgi:hypothetical protein